MDKRPIDIQREAAIHIKLPQNYGKIEEMHNIDEHLYAIAEYGIFEIILPDTIDPERTNPEIKPMVKEILNVGFSEPFVSRILGQVFEFSQILPQPALHEMLVIAFNILMSIDQMVETLIDLKEQTVSIIEKIDMHNNFNNSVRVSQISGLEFKSKAFLLEAHKVLKQVLQLLIKASNINNCDNFSKLVKITKNNNVKNIIEAHRKTTLEFIWEIRNAVEHTSDRKFIKINNISISVNNKITPPTWIWSYSSWENKTIKSKDNSSLLDDMDVIISNLLTLTEDALLCLALEKAYEIIPFEIEYKQNSEKCRYKVKYIIPNIKKDH